MEITCTDLKKILDKYTNNIQNEITERWNSISMPCEGRELIEVVFGLLSRQLALTIYFLRSPYMWNRDSGFIILRTTAENIINLSWILKEDSLKRAQMFISYGLGQEKLFIEHIKEKVKTEKISDEAKEAVENLERNLSMEQYPILTDVNLGSWSGKPIIKIAEEADCIDFYHNAFTPFSHSSHGTWNHIIKHSLKYSSNPLHNLIKRPIFFDYEPDLYIVEVAMIHFNRAIKKYDEHFKYSSPNRNAYDIYNEDIEAINNSDIEIH